MLLSEGLEAVVNYSVESCPTRRPSLHESLADQSVLE